MMPPPFFSHLVVLGLLWWFVMLHDAWPSRCLASPPQPAKPIRPLRQRASDPKPFPGLPRQPPWAAWEQAHADAPQPPGGPPPRLVPTRGRPRPGETSQPVCPSPDWADQGRVGLGKLCAHGPPHGGPWRPRQCPSGGGSCQETHGTPVQGTRVAPAKLGWAVGALAEGVGLRAVARGLEVDPNTVLPWLGEGAEHAAAVSGAVLHDGRGTQGPRDELCARLRAVQAGAVSAAAASTR
jgi:hypothetical protein